MLTYKPCATVDKDHRSAPVGRISCTPVLSITLLSPPIVGDMKASAWTLTPIFYVDTALSFRGTDIYSAPVAYDTSW